MSHLPSVALERVRPATTVPVYVPIRDFIGGNWNGSGWYMSESPRRFEATKRRAKYHGVYNPDRGIFVHMSRTQIASLIFDGYALREKHHGK